MIRLKRLYAHNFKQLQEIELHFPEASRILVQGKNEAGKSTLFEAVFFALFGSALATETGARGLDGLIAYGTEKARVELDLLAGDRLFKITRTIVRDKSNVWELEVTRDGNPPEEVRGNTAVNKRLVAELGFDGEALLNSCFVEQKKLEKLEGLNKAKREESLAKLLNLDAMVDLENNLKIRAEDKQEIDRLRKRAELSDIQADSPDREKDLATVEGKLQLIDLRRAVEGATAELQTVAGLDATICDLAARRDAVAQQVERIDALKEAMQTMKEARDAAERMTENAREVERLKTEQSELARALEDAPRLQERSRDLRRLSRMVKRLDQVRGIVESTTARTAQLVSAQARLVDLSNTISREELALARLEKQVGDYDLGQLLGEWIEAQNAIVPAEQVEQQVREKETVRDQLSRRFRVEIYGLTTLLFIFVIAAFALQALAPLFLLLAVLTLAALAARITLLWRDLARAAEALGAAHGEARARASASEAKVTRLKQVQARLGQAGIPIPESPDLAHSRRVSIAREMENRTREELAVEQAGARERLVNARAVLGELEKQYGIASPGNLQSELEKCERLANKAKTVLARWQMRVQARAETLQVEAQGDAIARARAQTEAEVEQVQRRSADVTRLDQELTRRQDQSQAMGARAREAYDKARSIKGKAAPAGSNAWDDWNPALTAQDYNGLGKDLRREYDTLGGDAVLKQAREVEGELGRRQGERETRARNAAVLLARIEDLLKDARATGLSSPPELRELEELGERFRSIDLGDEATLRLEHRDLVGRLHSLRDRQSQLERELGLQSEMLDRAACRAEHEEKAREAQVRERGVEIVSLARRRIVQKVLPATMDYMRQILPTLTRDRYHDAQLDPETYKIQVWDERAGQGGAFKEKNIFSGGTKDQFSLALRLAFALATLPQERGSAPSFIFLDEPLGSFDTERADALIYLLTEGEIARAFDQIFLISHVHVDERLFTHRVILENGRVQFTDLPTA